MTLSRYLFEMSRSRRLSRHVGSPGPSGAGGHGPPLSSRGELLNHRVGHFDAAKNSSVAALVDSFNQTGFQSRNLGRCYRILMRMLTAPERPLIMMGLAGAMIPGGMRKVVRDMVHYRGGRPPPFPRGGHPPRRTKR